MRFVSKLKWIAMMAAVVALGAGGMMLIHQPGQDLPRYFKVPDFELTDSQGETVTLESLKGKVWVANFIFTSCPDICEVLSATMADLGKSFARHSQLHLVSLSVDPENDTPERLREYGEQFAADPAKWHFLTGKREALRALIVEGMKISLPASPPFHSDRFVLVDAAGYIRGFYSHGSERARQQLPKDISLLLRKLTPNPGNTAH